MELASYLRIEEREFAAGARKPKSELEANGLPSH